MQIDENELAIRQNDLERAGHKKEAHEMKMITLIGALLYFRFLRARIF